MSTTKQVEIAIDLFNRRVQRNFDVKLALFVHPIMRSYVINDQEMEHEINISKLFSWMLSLFKERNHSFVLSKR